MTFFRNQKVLNFQLALEEARSDHVQRKHGDKGWECLGFWGRHWVGCDGMGFGGNGTPGDEVGAGLYEAKSHLAFGTLFNYLLVLAQISSCSISAS